MYPSVFDVTQFPYNAKCDGSDDTAAIQAAIRDASRSTSTACGSKSVPATMSGSSVVKIPFFATVSQLVLPSHVVLAGEDWRVSGLVQLAGANKHMVILADAINTERVCVRNLYLNGNKSQQVGKFDCVRFDNTGASFDRNHAIENCFLENAGGNGISLIGPWGENRVINCLSYHHDGYGYFADCYDSMWEQLVGAMCGKAGLFATARAADNYIGASKFWYCGKVSNEAGLVNYGKRVRIVNVGCQDNYGPGFYLSGDSLSCHGLLADGNGKAPNSGVLAAGFKLQGLTNSIVQGVAVQLNEGPGTLTQNYGVDTSSNDNSGNVLTFITSAENIAKVNGAVGPNYMLLNGSVLQ